ncbi:MAG TPA: S8 family serine peptidase [Gaiellaceae bacterium]|nr:S8 family serine peptidase [Gaiellaceae bacterium]
MHGVALIAALLLPFHSGHAITAGRARAAHDLRSYPRTIVGLDRTRLGGAEFTLQASGAREIDPQLGLWRLPSATAARLLPALRAQGLVTSVTPDLPLRTEATQSIGYCTDPLCDAEWWIPHVGADAWTPPGPGFPVTLIDSGVDLSNPEFADPTPRPNTTALNTQTFKANSEEKHGTATSSVVGAPVNGEGVVGIYPQAKLQLWDASPGGQLTVGDEIAGLAAARAHGPGVVNLSLGGTDHLAIEEHAILRTFGSGSLVVASAGNDRQFGSPPSYPASFPHVLTIGATDEEDRPSVFSSVSANMDLAAPGQDMPVAVPAFWVLPGSPPYDTFDGTSFSAPLVSGAAAAVWTLRPTLTNTQLFEIMRRSARHVGKRGWNQSTGYGVLNIPAALARKAPPPDPEEPNEDVYLVEPHGLFPAGQPPLTVPGRPKRVLPAHLERSEDPEDVYRAYLPAKGKLVVTVTTKGNANLEVWGRHTRTVLERGAAARRDLLGVSARRGSRTERVVVPARGLGQYVYVDVFLAKNIAEASYTVRIATARR